MAAPRRVLVIHPGALGDVLLALPALAHLRALGLAPTVAAGPGPAALLAGSAFGFAPPGQRGPSPATPGGAPAYADRTVELDRLALHRLFVSDPDPAVVRDLRSYDAVVSWLGAGDATYAGHIMRLGRPAVVARATPPPDDRRHASRYLVDTLAPLGPGPAVLPAVRLDITGPEPGWALDWLAARRLAPGEPVVIHPGAGSPAKIWPHHDRLARRLAAGGRDVVVVTGPADDAAAARRSSEPPPLRVHVAPGLPLRRLAALLGNARAFVGNDSGPTHLAAAVGCPTLALFGPTDPARWAPLGERVRVLTGARPGAADPWEGLSIERVAAALATLEPAGADMVGATG